MHSDPAHALAELLNRPHGGPVWLRVGQLFDGETAAADTHLVFDAHAIRHLGDEPPVAVLRAGQSVPDLHLPGHTVLPGLVEAHAHLFLEGGEADGDKRAAYLALDDATLLANALPRLERLLRLGIVAVRDAGDRNGVGLALQARYRSPARGAMPYLDSPGPAIHHAGRYGKFMGRALEEDGDIVAAVAQRAGLGAHRIKLLATGIINFAKGAVTAQPQLPAEELTTAVTASRALGKQTMIHCSGHDGVANCIAARVDTIEHGFFIDRDQLAQLRDLDIAWVPTFAPVQFQHDHAAELGWDDIVRGHLRRILDDHAACLAHAGEIGVRVIAGSDAGSQGVAHGHGFLWELELMERAGLSAHQVLHAATGAAADRLGLAEACGRLRVGAPARLLLTAAPIFQSVTQLRAPLITICDGQVFTGGDNPHQPGL
jgi:imidazolonepropionase-like amidohydrolase